MQQGSLTRPSQLPRALSGVGSIVVALILSSSCARTGNAENSIVVDREVLVPGLVGKPTRMARLTNGGFVIVGARGTAWAAGTDAQGKLLWKYEEPSDPSVKLAEQSGFNGVVPLSSGNVLLCGKHSTNESQTGLLIILDGGGRVVERRRVFPNDDRGIFSSSFESCIPWGGGFAVMGAGTDGRKGFFWLMRLDKNGVIEWEKAGPEVPGFVGVATADQNLVLMGNIAGFEGGVIIAKINQQGHTIVERKTGFLEAAPVRSLDSHSGVMVVAVDKSFHSALLSLNGDLRDGGSDKPAGLISIRDGCAYELLDRSVVLFGNRPGSVYRSAIEWINRGGKGDEVREMTVPSPRDSSFSMSDAVPLSANKFAAIRDQVTAAPENTGVVLSWLTFK